MLYTILEESFWLPSKPATSAPAWEAYAQVMSRIQALALVCDRPRYLSEMRILVESVTASLFRSHLAVYRSDKFSDEKLTHGLPGLAAKIASE